MGEENSHFLLEGAFSDGIYKKKEFSLKRRDGSEVILGFTTSPLREEKGTVAGAIVLFRDLTEQKRLQLEIQRMDRLASLGVLSAGVAHEIKNPLAIIRLSLDFLKDSVPPDKGEEIKVISTHLGRLDKIVNGLLRFSKPSQPKWVNHDVNAIVHNTMVLIQKRCQSQGIRIEQRLDSDLPVIKVDENQIQQVLLNVALNAIESMPEGGVLTVKSRRCTDIDKTRGSKIDYVEVAVSDTGGGLGQEEINYIFSPFYSTKDEGTGLGLAVAFRIMKDHNGYIYAENVGGGGARFRIGVPVSGTKE